ncbi:MAG: hypothetical protein ACKO16_03020 [Gemmataceae bacterium]
MAFHHACAILTTAAQNMKSMHASRFRAIASPKRKTLFVYVHSS